MLHVVPPLYRVHIWNSYCTPFSSCTPRGTSNPTQFWSSSWVHLDHLAIAASSAFKKSGRNTSHSSNEGDTIRVKMTLSTNVGEEGGSSSVSLYSLAPPIMKTRFTSVFANPESCVLSSVKADGRSALKRADDVLVVCLRSRFERSEVPDIIALLTADNLDYH